MSVFLSVDSIIGATASDVLRRMLDEGLLQIARKGKPLHEALYVRSQPTK